jgi:hypothetical protein
MKYPFIERLKYSEITTPTFGVLIDDTDGGTSKRKTMRPVPALTSAIAGGFRVHKHNAIVPANSVVICGMPVEAQ